jgi:hypothetical protein
VEIRVRVAVAVDGRFSGRSHTEGVRHPVRHSFHSHGYAVDI